jgi:putative oxidoreductase
MLKRLLDTGDEATATVLRVTLGGLMFAHGAQKLLGWFGGFGFEGTMGFLTGTIGLPALLAVLIILLEFFGGIALMIGLAGRLMATGFAAIMLGAIFTVHAQNGFFMNWTGSQAGEGFEFHLLALAMAVALILKGSGALSVDRVLAARVT